MAYNYEEYQREYRKQNLERARENKRAWRAKQRELHGSYQSTSPEYVKKWREENQDKVKEYSKFYYEENIESIKAKKKNWRKAASDLISVYNKEYRKNNRGKCNAYSAKRRAQKRNATPPWLTKEDYESMKQFYDEAVRLSEETGIDHAVDHIHPLLGEFVCGLHVPWNLQVLTRSDNSSKRNSLHI